MLAKISAAIALVLAVMTAPAVDDAARGIGYPGPAYTTPTPAAPELSAPPAPWPTSTPETYPAGPLACARVELRPITGGMFGYCAEYVTPNHLEGYPAP